MTQGGLNLKAGVHQWGGEGNGLTQTDSSHYFVTELKSNFLFGLYYSDQCHLLGLKVLQSTMSNLLLCPTITNLNIVLQERLLVNVLATKL